MPGTAVSQTTTSLAGFYGKLPSRGDFIGRHLAQPFLARWDAWLQTAIAQSRARMGEEAWREHYRISPIWRFALNAGLCGAEAYGGILMPSMDRVGRYYPLVIAAPLASDGPLLGLAMTDEPWFRQAEELALAALERDALDLDAFSNQVTALGAPRAPFANPGQTVSGDAWHCPLPALPDLPRVAPALASHLLRRAFPEASVWWTEGSKRIDPCLLICAGLPSAAGFTALLRGDWRQSGWTEQSFVGDGCSVGGSPAAEET